MGTGHSSPSSGVVGGDQGDVPASFTPNGDQERDEVILLQGIVLSVKSVDS